MPEEAGHGDHRIYHIPPDASSDTAPLKPAHHYLGIDAVAWFINKEDSWFSDRMASGTLEITLSGGLEKYESGLGTFELSEGAKTAPVFEQPVLPDRNFLGGPIGLNASLTAIKKDTVLAGMLKSAANASLGIVAGMVQTASVAGTAAGPTQLLAAAGGQLISGVRGVLSDTADKREPLFDFSGLKYNVRPTELLGPENFILFHRGAPLDDTQLSVLPQGTLRLPFYRGVLLEDGAWLLLRFRRSDEYSGVRDWFERAKRLRGQLRAVTADVASDSLTKTEALKRLKPSLSGDSTLFDEFSQLRAVILSDGVMSEREAALYVGNLNAAVVAAKSAVRKHEPEAAFENLTNELAASLMEGNMPKGLVGKAFVDEARSLSSSRRKARGEPMDSGETATVKSMKYLPKSIEGLL